MTSLRILMADDDPLDQVLIKEAFEEAADTAHAKQQLFFVNDGNELMKYLRRAPPYTDNEKYPMPCLLLLDLNMPKKDGFDCLKEIRSEASLKHLPVIVMTTSQRDEDIYRCYALGANSCHSKPVDFGELVSQVRLFSHYWLSTVELPDESQ